MKNSHSSHRVHPATVELNKRAGLTILHLGDKLHRPQYMVVARGCLAIRRTRADLKKPNLKDRRHRLSHKREISGRLDLYGDKLEKFKPSYE